MAKKEILKTVKERVAYLLRLNPKLRQGSNDNLIEAYRKQYDDKAASESISRTWRAWKQEGLFKSR